ncbi:MAG: IS1595 family transposase, partial [Gammaproteobacteria bacterium]|nr:IS1595 family transposase [Gammaproteobacteria bacterium]
RGAAGKMPFIAAVQTSEDGRPLKLALRAVEGFTCAEVVRFSQKTLQADSHVYSDGLGCFTGVRMAGCSHTVVIAGSRRRAAQHPTFRWVNTMLANIKNAMLGTYRQISLKHSPRYLAEFQYRFNRRFKLEDMLPRLAYACVRTLPMPY